MGDQDSQQQANPNLEPVDHIPQFDDLEPVDHQPEWQMQMTHQPQLQTPHPGLMLAARMMDTGGRIWNNMREPFDWWTGSTISEKLQHAGVNVPPAIANADKAMRDFLQRDDVNTALGMAGGGRGSSKLPRRAVPPELPPEVQGNVEATRTFNLINDRLAMVRKALEDALRQGNMADFTQQNKNLRVLFGALEQWQKKYNVDYLAHLNRTVKTARGSPVEFDPTEYQGPQGFWDSPDKLERLKAMHKAGTSYEDMAKSLGTTEDIVRSKIRRENIAAPGKNMVNLRFDPEMGPQGDPGPPPQPGANKPVDAPYTPTGGKNDPYFEREILRMRAMGLSDYDIGSRFGLGPKQIKQHFTRIKMREQGIRNGVRSAPSGEE